MAEHWHLRIDGIDGESSAKGHEHAIDVLAWSWGVGHAGGHATGSGGGTGRATFQDFAFVARMSVASPGLMLHCANGTHIPWAVLTGERGAGKAFEFVKYRMSDVTVTRVDHADDEDGVPIEEFALGYRKFEITYTPQSATGKTGTPVHAGWDVEQNQQL
jgi:type VI secretion system secreted protein Hcp